MDNEYVFLHLADNVLYFWIIFWLQNFYWSVFTFLLFSTSALQIEVWEVVIDHPHKKSWQPDHNSSESVVLAVKSGLIIL